MGMIHYCAECKRDQIAVWAYWAADKEVIDLECGHEA